jgi:hypothetical protein
MRRNLAAPQPLKLGRARGEGPRARACPRDDGPIVEKTMSNTDLLEAARDEAAAAPALMDQIRRKALDLTGEARDLAADVAAQARELARDRARSLRAWARGRARDEVTARRTAAADKLETLADILRPDADQRRRRKTFAMVGGTGVALTAAVGVGVALGYMLNRELKKRAAAKAAATSQPTATLASAPNDPNEPAGYDAEAGAGLGAV